MPLFFPTSEFFQASGNAAALFNEQLRDGIVTHICNLWSIYPRFFTQGTNPVSSFARGYMNQMCSPIQPFVPAPSVPFTGGQCCDLTYDVEVTFDLKRCFNNDTINSGVQTRTIAGKIIDVFLQPCTSNPSLSCIEVQYENCAGDTFFEQFFSTTRSIAPAACFTTNPTDPDADDIDPVASTFTITNITVVGGGSDNCGDPPAQYPGLEPSPGDFDTTIVIVNLDGTDNVYNLTYNKVDTNYNFPINFKLNGTNINLDLGGLSIYGNPGTTTTNTGNESPPPGSDGGKNEEGDDYLDPDPNSEYPVANPPAIIEPIEEIIDYLVCEEGILTPISEALQAIPGIPAAVKIIVAILVNILEDLCVEQASEVGFPEVYPVLPGVRRPAIVYYFKEFVGMDKLPSTYTSTVSNPTAAAIADIPTVVVPDKQMGKYVVALKLLDGTRISSSGIDETAALAGYNFLLSQVEPSLIPTNEAEVRSVTFRDILQEKDVKCTQIEYYPDGKQQGVSPAEVRFINPFA